MDGASDSNPFEDLRRASDQFVSGVLNTGHGFSNLVVSTWRVMGEHEYLRLIRYPIALGLTALVGRFIISLGRKILSYLLLDGIAAKPDIEVQTTPLPLGVSVTVLILTTGVVALLGFMGYVRLRQRIETLEREVGE